MKKLLLSFAILAAVASCAKNEVIESPQLSEEISFTSLNDRIVSRAASETAGTYNVYALASANASSFFFSGLAVTSEASSNYNSTLSTDSSKSYTELSTDTYTGTKFWPSYALDFYAYAAASANVGDITTDYATSAITFPYTVPTGADDDLTVAAPIKSKTSGTVDFVFSHLLSKVTIKLVIDSNMTGASNYTLNDTWTANLNVAYNVNTADVVAAGWSSTTTPSSSIATGDDTTHTYSKASTSLAAPSFMILPQEMISSVLTFSGVTITYSDTNSTNEPVITSQTLSPYTFTGNEVTNGEGTDAVINDEFQAGYHYVITVTIGSGSTYDPDPEDPEDPDLPIFNIISFTSQLANWTDATIAITSPNESGN